MCSTVRLFAAMQGKDCVGVFSTGEGAAAVSDAVVDLDVACLPGTPEYNGYVCCARGTWTMLERTETGFDMRCMHAGPCWGVNLQSAFAGLYGPSWSRRGVALSELRIYEIDRAYPDHLPKDLADEFHIVCTQLAADGAPTAEELAVDYIGIYLQRQAYMRELGERLDSPYMELIMDAAAKAFTRGRKVRCGFTLDRALRRMKELFARCFTLEELRILTVVWGLQPDQEVTVRLIGGGTRPETVQDILKRAKECVYPTTRKVNPGEN